MNPFKKLLLAFNFLLVLTTSALAAPPELVLVRKYGSNLFITRGNGKTEKLTMKPTMLKNVPANLEQLHEVFSKLYAEGYVLQNSSASEFRGNTEEMTYVFVKPN